jgi:hypothetical protein
MYAYMHACIHTYIQLHTQVFGRVDSYLGEKNYRIVVLEAAPGYICMHVFIYVYVYVYICMYMYVCMYVCMYIYIYIYIYISSRQAQD